jgi:hypothetical protein
MNYPQRVNFYSNDLSVVRAGGPDFEKLFGRLRIDLLRVIRFILEHGKCNRKCDGNQALGHQKQRIQIGCCGQAQGGVVNGVNAPKSTYGLGIFDEINDPTERQSIKKMFADVLDCIQDCEDFVELKKLSTMLSAFNISGWIVPIFSSGERSSPFRPSDRRFGCLFHSKRK